MDDKTFALAWILSLILILFVSIWDAKKYKRNIPYKNPKGKKSFLNRISLGLVAGLHYTHLIGTYKHEKYNTQVFFPKTLECAIGLIFTLMIILAYFIIIWFLYPLIGYLSIFVFLIPIVINILSIFHSKRYSV